jgi:hypothetical protein
MHDHTIERSTGTAARGYSRALFHAGAAAALLLLLETVASVDIRRREMLGIYAAVLGFAMLYARPQLKQLPFRAVAALVATFAVSLGLVLAAASQADERQMVLVDGLLPTLSGWAALLVLLRAADAPVVTRLRVWRLKPGHLALLLSGTALLLTLTHALAVGRWAAFGDETIYLVQSRWMSLSALTWTVDPEIADFFRARKIDHIDGRMYGMYPPGWPALLAVFRAVGLEWWSGIILGTASVALIYFIALRAVGRTAAVMAAVLLATSQQFLIAHAGYMAHPASIAATLGAVLCLLEADARPSLRPFLWPLAGVLLGFVVTARPLTGLTLGVSVGLWMMLRMRGRPLRDHAVLGCFVALGGLLPAALLLAHNHHLYGDAFGLGYSAMGGSVYDLGFGPRGISVILEDLQRGPLTSMHTPQRAVSDLLRRLTGMNTAYVPIGMLLPLAGLAVGLSLRLRWSHVAAFVVLPLVHMLYWFSGLRLYTELLPFVLLGVAAILAGLRRSRPQLALALFATLIAASSIMSLPWPRRDHDDGRRWSEYGYTSDVPVPMAALVRADSLGRAHNGVVLFVSERTRYDTLLGALYLFNGDGLDGHVLSPVTWATATRSWPSGCPGGPPSSSARARRAACRSSVSCLPTPGPGGLSGAPSREA